MSIELQMSQNSWSIAFWLSIGLCYNKRLLNMTDKRISLFIKNASTMKLYLKRQLLKFKYRNKCIFDSGTIISKKRFSKE